MDFGTPIEVLSDRMTLLWQIGFGDDKEFITRYLSAYDSPSSRLIRTDEDGQLVAFMHYHQFITSSYSGAYIYGITTLPQFRGRGLARQLIVESFHIMYKRGYTFAMLIAEEKSLTDWYATFDFAIPSHAPLSIVGSDGMDFGMDDKSLNIGQYRITNVMTYLQIYLEENPHVDFTIDILDELIPANTGHYTVRKSSVTFTPLHTDTQSVAPSHLFSLFPIKLHTSITITTNYFSDSKKYFFLQQNVHL